ncbi:TadE/TadG family protein [Rhizobium sp. ARZ01]|uniref:pilus assembly protein n=1 Tax=Rhizobium sp. ARZ01 TaxID=2769313 RepID=UPI00177B2F57|nr:pilus assembly protein [Rhizobium sp. ARZ01]MBD9373548.1 TadE/TadG family protein [Rhizobium sp. ARZ01]
MKLATEKQGILSRLARDRRGNFGFMTAILLPVLLGAGGISIDVTKMMMVKTRLQDAVDSAALAAASALADNRDTNVSEDDKIKAAKLLALEFLQTQLNDGSLLGEEAATEEQKQEQKLALASATTIEIPPPVKSGTGKTFVVNISTSTTMALNPLTRLLVKDKATLKASTKAESARELGSISMYLVLDKSGSMKAPTDQLKDEDEKDTLSCDKYNDNGQRIATNQIPCYFQKIEYLKVSARGMFNYFRTLENYDKFVRVGTVSYNNKMGKAYNLSWGVNDAETQVDGLVAGDGTSSTAAMQKAYDKLKDPLEDKAHIDRGHAAPTKYIVFMTDGNNNNSYDDVKTAQICEDAKNIDKIYIFTIAFMAPENGRILLENCSKGNGKHFAPTDSEGLQKAFIEIGEKAAEGMARLTQ